MEPNQKKSIISFIIKVFVFVFLFLPFFLLLGTFLKDLNFSLDFFDLVLAIKNTLIQIIGTLIISIILGIGLFFSLLALNDRWRKFSWVCIIPFLLPPLYIISSFYSFISFINLGNFFIILVQGISLSGYIGFYFYRYYLESQIRYESMAKVFGASFFTYWKAQLKDMRPALINMTLFAVFFSLTSFSIPLMFGGLDSNLEIIIFEKLRFGFKLGEALSISLIQIFFLLFFEFFRNKKINFRPFSSQKKLKSLYTKKHFLLILFIYLVFFIWPFFKGLTQGLYTFIPILIQDTFVQEALLNSLRLLIFSYFIFMFLFICLSYFFFFLKLNFFLLIWLSPSVSLLGVSLWTLNNDSSHFTLFLGYFYLFMPALLKLGLVNDLEFFENKYQMARTMGSSPFLFFKKIMWPLLFSKISLLSSVGAFWVYLDFSLPRYFVDNAQSFASVMIQSWFGAYRYYEASGFLTLLMLIGVLGVLGVNRLVNVKN